MPDHIELLRAARGVSMTSAEESALRARIAEVMEEYPLVMARTGGGLTGVRNRFLPLFTHYFNRMPIALAALLLFSGGTALAAQGALPGSVLYPIKINVDENLQSLVALTPLQKASIAADHASERVTEAETLSAQGALSGHAREELQAALGGDLTALQRDISRLEQQDPHAAEAIALKLKGTLNAHHALLFISGLSTATSSTATSTATSSTQLSPSIQIVVPLLLHAKGFDGAAGAVSVTGGATLTAHIDGRGRIHESEGDTGEGLLPNSSGAPSASGAREGSEGERGTRSATSTLRSIPGIIAPQGGDDGGGESRGSVHLEL